MPAPAESARRLAEDVLAPTSEATDTAGQVPPGHVALLAETGLLGLGGPVASGGVACSSAERRTVHRLLAGACGATALLWARHHAALDLVAASPNPTLRDRWLAPMCRGEVLAGAASEHLRSVGPAVVGATADGDGWRLDGRIPWVAGLGRVGPTAVAAHTTEGDVLWALVHLDDAPGVTATARLDVAALQGVAPARVHMEGVRVDPDDVVLQVPPDLWWSIDDLAAARPDPAVGGVTARALSLLAGVAPDSAAALAADLARHDADEADLQNAADDGTVDPADLAVAAAAGVAMALRATATLLAATGPAGMERSHPAQRLAREVLHHASRLGAAATRSLATAAAPVPVPDAVS